jgi:ribosomal protein S4
MRKFFEADEVRTWLHEAFEAGYKQAMGPLVPRDMAFQKKTLAKLQTIAPEVMDKGIEAWRYLTSEEHELREHRIRRAARLVGKDEEHAVSMILDGSSEEETVLGDTVDRILERRVRK